MSTRTLTFVLIATTIAGALVIEDSSAKGRRFGKRFFRFGVSRSQSWGGCYGRTGSSGTPVVMCSHRTSVPSTTTVVSSFGSRGGSGGAYVSTGSSGGLIVSSPNNETVSPSANTTSVDAARTIQPEQKTVQPEQKSTEIASKQSIENSDTALKALGNSVLASKEVVVPDVAPKATKTQAYLVLKDVPVGAEIYLLGVKMTARGATRKYRIPLHAANVEYDYQVELKLPGNEGTIAATTTQVKSGQTTVLWVTGASRDLAFIESAEPQQSIPLAVR